MFINLFACSAMGLLFSEIVAVKVLVFVLVGEFYFPSAMGSVKAYWGIVITLKIFYLRAALCQ